MLFLVGLIVIGFGFRMLSAYTDFIAVSGLFVIVAGICVVVLGIILWSDKDVANQKAKCLTVESAQWINNSCLVSINGKLVEINP